jgi:hypothetical protein
VFAFIGFMIGGASMLDNFATTSDVGIKSYDGALSEEHFPSLALGVGISTIAGAAFGMGVYWIASWVKVLTSSDR